MKKNLDFSVSRDHLFIPALDNFYETFAMPVGWLLLRLILGGWMLIEGWPKLMSPLSQVGFVEMIGFHPGWLFSPLLAVLQVVGGASLILGLYTRPFAFASTVMLLVTVYYHLHFPYDAAPLLTQAGIDALKANPQWATPSGAKRLADGGVFLTNLMQHKALQLSSIWAVGNLFFAAFGGGPLSVDRKLGKTF